MKTTFRMIAAFGFVALLISYTTPIKALDSGDVPAQISLNDGHDFALRLSSVPVRVEIDVAAHDWLNQTVETYAWIEAWGEQGIARFYFSDGEWRPFDDFPEMNPMGTITLTDMTDVPWTVFDDASDFPYGSMRLTFCLDTEVDGRYSAGTAVCDSVVLALVGVETLTPGTISGSVRAASVRTTEGVSMGIAIAEPPASGGQVEFDLSVAPRPGLLWIAGLDTIDGFSNPELEGVRVTLKQVDEEDGGETTVAAMNNGEPNFLQLFSFNSELLIPSPAYVEAFEALLTQMGLPPGTPVLDAIARLQDPQSATSAVDESLLETVLTEMANYEAQLTLVVNSALPTERKPGTPPVLGIVNPWPGTYRVQVRSESSAGSSGVFAAYVPFLVTVNGMNGTGPEWTNLRLGSVLQAERLLEQELSAGSTSKQLNGLEPASLFRTSRRVTRTCGGDVEIPEACKGYVDSVFNKGVTALIFNAGTRAIGGIVGGVAGLAGAGAERAGRFGQWVGFAAGALSKFTEWGDCARLSVRFLIAQAWPTLDRVAIRTTSSSVCQGSSTTVYVGFFNRCDGPLFGTLIPSSTLDDATIHAVPAVLGDFQYEGFAAGIDGLWGSGARFTFTGVLEGKGRIEVSVPTADGLLKASVPIEVKKCASPNVQLWRLR